MKKISRFKVSAVIIVLLSIMMSSCFLINDAANAARGVSKKTINADSIISNYQWFYDQKGAIDSQKANYDSMPDSAPEKNGIRMVLNGMIGEYNSRSKQINRNMWKASDLPQSIALIGGNK